MEPFDIAADEYAYVNADYPELIVLGLTGETPQMLGWFRL
jgi:hypothetical protein